MKFQKTETWKAELCYCVGYSSHIFTCVVEIGIICNGYIKTALHSYIEMHNGFHLLAFRMAHENECIRKRLRNHVVYKIDCMHYNVVRFSKRFLHAPQHVTDVSLSSL